MEETKAALASSEQTAKAHERVVKETKKQLKCYKEELTGIKKMESYLTMESYQKLINEFNQLYDHYRALKRAKRRLRQELQQA